MIPAMEIGARIVISVSMLYFLVLMGAGLRHLRTQRTGLSVQGHATYGEVSTPAHERFRVYFLVPCLNEEAVIEQTVRGLTRLDGTTTIVIDDASDDRTAELALAAGGDRVEVLSRRLPDARIGKGEALNAAVDRVRELAAARGERPDDVIVCVMDADGRLSDGALDHVLPLFEPDSVGAAQLQVRIRNRGAFLTRYQDYQFWGIAAITQLGRMGTATVSLGGNGQFAKLSALNDAGRRPWSGSLTEDLDLGITLSLAGWDCVTTPHASVDQQAVENLGLLIKQRTRWYQGHMMASARIPEIWRSKTLPNGKALELVSYCLVPWLLDLPWSILFHYTIWSTWLNRDVLLGSMVGDGWSGVVVLLVWYLLAFTPALITGWIYYRRDERWGLWRSLAMGNSFIVMNYLSFTCVWRALFRIVQGRTGWDKTARVDERPAVEPTVVPVGVTA